MTSVVSKGTETAGNPKLPLVKLNATSDKDGHKRPIERDWQNKRYTIDEADAWIEAGYGVGINIGGTATLGVLDIDTAGAAADAVARWCGEAGALVCATPSGGYHIFLGRHTFPFSDGRYLLRTPVGEVKVEWYRGDGARNIVLPVLRTPRAKLRGHVVWCNGQAIGEPVTLATMVEWLADAAGRTISGAELRFTEGDEGKIKRTFGRSIGELTKDDIERTLRNAREGERHNTLLLAAIAHRMRGWDLEALRKAGLELFAGERTARDEVEGILDWVRKLQIEPYVETAESAVKRRKASLPDIIAAAFPEGVLWTAYGDETYILTGGYALRGVEGLAAYLAARDFPVSTERAKRVLYYIRAHYTQHEEAVILRSFPTYTRHGFIVGVRVSDKVLALVAGGGRLELRDPAHIGAYVEFGGVYRTISAEDMAHAEQIADELLAILRTFFVGVEGAEAWIALLIAAAVLSRSVIFITGASGSGKSTLSLLLQYIVNGRAATLSTHDKRDLIALIASAKLIAFEEAERLSGDFWSDIKIFTTLGEVAERTLYTNTGVTAIQGANSFIVAATDVERMPGDVLRRAVSVSPRIERHTLPEDTFIEALRADAPRLIVGLMHLAKDYTQATKVGLLDLLAGRHEAALPDWLRRANKADLALAYHYMYQRLGVSEVEARAVWETARQNAATKGVGLWGEVVELAERDGAFAELLRGGATAAQIAEKLQISVRKAQAELPKLINKVAPVLEEWGWSVETTEGRNENRKKVRLYFLRRAEPKVKARAKPVLDEKRIEAQLPQMEAELAQLEAQLPQMEAELAQLEAQIAQAPSDRRTALQNRLEHLKATATHIKGRLAQMRKLHEGVGAELRKVRRIDNIRAIAAMLRAFAGDMDALQEVRDNEVFLRIASGVLRLRGAHHLGVIVRLFLVFMLVVEYNSSAACGGETDNIVRDILNKAADALNDLYDHCKGQGGEVSFDWPDYDEVARLQSDDELIAYMQQKGFLPCGEA